MFNIEGNYCDIAENLYMIF